MANEPTIIGALSSGDSRSSLYQDPFWQETPRYNRGSLAALMTAIQQVSLFLSCDQAVHYYFNTPARNSSGHTYPYDVR